MMKIPRFLFARRAYSTSSCNCGKDTDKMVEAIREERVLFQNWIIRAGFFGSIGWALGGWLGDAILKNKN